MKAFTLLLFVACAASASAEPSADLEKEKAELLRIHKSDREAHFKTDVEGLLENSPEEFISVGIWLLSIICADATPFPFSQTRLL